MKSNHLFRSFLIAILAMVALAILSQPIHAAVSKSAQSATDAPTLEATETATDSAACNKNQVIAHLKTLITYKEFDITYAGTDQFTALNIWFVDPQLDPNAKTKDILLNAALALHDAAALIQQFVVSDACITTLFDFANPIVVDSHYNGWLSATTVLLSKSVTSPQTGEEGIQAIQKSFKTDFLRDKPAAVFGPAPKNSCTWATVYQNLFTRQFNPKDQLYSFMYILDPTGVNVYVEFDADASLLGSSAAQKAVILADLMDALIEIKCLYPVPDRIIVQAVDANGKYVMLGELPPSALKTSDPSVVNKLLKAKYVENQ
jgi:hypothetical protein